jgi:hypothetical protein
MYVHPNLANQNLGEVLKVKFLGKLRPELRHQIPTPLKRNQTHDNYHYFHLSGKMKILKSVRLQ